MYNKLVCFKSWLGPGVNLSSLFPKYVALTKTHQLSVRSQRTFYSTPASKGGVRGGQYDESEVGRVLIYLPLISAAPPLSLPLTSIVTEALRKAPGSPEAWRARVL